MAKAPYNSAAWRAVRLRVLERDQWQCQLRYRGCLGRADSADHTISVRRLPPNDPALLHPGNLVAACTPCNTRKRNAEARRLRRLRPTPPATTQGRGDAGSTRTPPTRRRAVPSRPAQARRVSRDW